MCLGIWSRLGYVKDSDIKAVVALPGVPANAKEDIRYSSHWVGCYCRHRLTFSDPVEAVVRFNTVQVAGFVYVSTVVKL